jgi:hypothetical protein
VRPVALRVSLDERRELTLIAGQKLIAQSVRLVLLSDVRDVRLQLAGQRGPDGGNVLFRQ